MRINQLSLDQEFVTENGITYTSINASYNSIGKLNEQRNNVIWIIHGLTANSNPTDWWPNMIGPGKVFDTDHYFVLCVNMLGSCYGTEYYEKKPLRKLNPYQIRFSITDQVHFLQQVAKKLKIKSVFLLVGASVGGFTALEWAIIDPLFTRNLTLVATSYYVSPWAAAFNEAQRLALIADATYKKESGKKGKSGLMAARAIALLSYRNYQAFKNTQQGKNKEKPYLHNATTYQNYQGQKLANRFTALSYLTILNTIDSFDLLKQYNSHEQSLEIIIAKTLIIGFNTDILFPIEEQYEMASMISNSTIRIVDCDFGHDSFLLKEEQISNLIKQTFNI